MIKLPNLDTLSDSELEHFVNNCKEDLHTVATRFELRPSVAKTVQDYVEARHLARTYRKFHSLERADIIDKQAERIYSLIPLEVRW